MDQSKYNFTMSNLKGMSKTHNRSDSSDSNSTVDLHIDTYPVQSKLKLSELSSLSKSQLYYTMEKTNLQPHGRK